MENVIPFPGNVCCLCGKQTEEDTCSDCEQSVEDAVQHVTAQYERGEISKETWRILLNDIRRL